MAQERSGSLAGRIVTGAAIGAGAVAATGVGMAAAITVIAARTVITPPRRRAEDVRILRHDASTITLSATLDSLTPGRYTLWFRGDAGAARVGEILRHDAETVTRRLLGVDRGDLAGATRGRFSGWYYLTPEDLGVPHEDVTVPTELGPAPAWHLSPERPSTRWFIGVHGRAVRRQETLRAVPVFRAAGYHSLLVSYRNDGDAPNSADGRYGLGSTEWRDVEAAMRYAVDRGATELVLMGWSMGGATVLQAVTRAEHAELVTGVVLESPVVDWVTVLHYQGVVNRLPKLVQWGVLKLLSRTWAVRVTGQSAPIDLTSLDFVARAQELRTPILLLHSDDDGYVPATASRALALARPDIVTFEPFSVARHTKLWNYDSERFDRAIARFLTRLG